MQQQLGSGKTAVLVERILNKIINEKIDIDKILVVTFTNAAASEMKQRILEAIYQKIEEEPENQNLQRQVILLNKASICTIDSFCLEVVRNHFYELENISPNFIISDMTQIELLQQEVLEEMFEEKYENQDKNFIKLIYTYTSYKDDTPLKDLILKIYNYMQSSPFPKKWLEEHIEMFNIKEKIEQDFSTTPWGEILLQECMEELIDCISSLKQAKDILKGDIELEKFETVINQDIQMLEILKENCDNWDKSYDLYKNLNFSTWPRQKGENELKEQAKKIRDDVKKKLNLKLDKIFIGTSKQNNLDIYEMYGILQNLQDIILEFDEKFSKVKREKNMVDFSDIEHLTLSILGEEKEGKFYPSHVGLKYQEKFEEIAIDEYQDSNLVQEYIMNAISRGNNLFMVGDVKQSIYKFRQAMPELFLSKYYTYPKKEEQNGSKNLKIQLFKNFRSRKEILDFTNIIFENIMSQKLGDVEYIEEEFLNLGATDYLEQETSEKFNNLIEIDIIDTKKQEDTENEDIECYSIEEQEKVLNEDIEEERLENIELEAKFVANKIKQYIEEKFQVYDRKNKCFRNLEYKDIVILLRSTKDKANIFEQEISKLDMPVFSDNSEQYLNSIEIQTILNLLKIIDNPMQDIALITVLRSSIGGFTDNELIKIRLIDRNCDFYTAMLKAKLSLDEDLKQKIENFLLKLKKWRKEQEYLSLEELLGTLYMETGYYHLVGLMNNGLLKQANLKILLEKAKKFEEANFKGVYHFIKFIEKIENRSGDLSPAKIIGENDNVIRIMSIHKSKGLEFPLVFLSNTGKQFNMQDIKLDPILLEQELGIGVKYIDYENQIEYDTLSRSAVKSKIITENLAEEMRVLYVALTRAKEKLIITSVINDYEKSLQDLLQSKDKYPKTNGKINPILVKKQKRYIDWITLSYIYAKNEMQNLVEFNILNKNTLLKQFITQKDTSIDVLKDFENAKISNEEYQNIDKQITQKYLYEEETKLPTKTSVTKIKELKNLNKIKEKQTVENSLNNITFSEPNFLKNNVSIQITPAKKGSLVHMCLQRLEIKEEYTLDEIKVFINNLVEKQIITQAEGKSINPKKIYAYTKTDLWKKLNNAKQIHKEHPFYVSIPAKEIFENDVQEEILVQGIIDLFFISKQNELILVDYKTDYIQEGKIEDFVEKYKEQVDLYKYALEEAFDKKVDKVYLYSTYLEKEIEL